ncbi:hypothetical protein AHAS_Ahas19G0186300 [Arachis hypogaea]
MLRHRTATAAVGLSSLSWRIRESQRHRFSPPPPSFSRRSSGRSSLALSLSLPITLVFQPLSQPLGRCSLRRHSFRVPPWLNTRPIVVYLSEVVAPPSPFPSLVAPPFPSPNPPPCHPSVATVSHVQRLERGKLFGQFFS